MCVCLNGQAFGCIIYCKLCVCSPVAEVSTDRPSYTVPEDIGQLEVWVSITNGQKAPGQKCLIAVETVDGSAQGKLRLLKQASG